MPDFLSFFLRIAFAFFVAFGAPAFAQDAPPAGILDRIIDGLGKRLPRTPPVFEKADGAPDPVCGLQAFGMTLAKGTSKQRRYSVLMEPQNASVAAPKQMLVRIQRLSVDADGSERAYHPEDPSGRGICTRERGPDGKEKLTGICALDAFSSGGLRLYVDAKQVPLMTKVNGANTLNPDFDREWKSVWPQIRDQKLKAFTLESLTKRDVPTFYYLFYDKTRRATFLMKNNIIPTDRAGYPCLRGAESRYPGYFVASTTLQQSGAKARGDGCTPLSFIDAETVPFFVLPYSPMGGIAVGDIVIGHLKTGQGERLVYGFAAETGPPGQFGEGSYAFARMLRGGDVPESPMNVTDVYKADIGPAWLRANGASLSILALGGTKALLRDDFSKENVERIGREEFAKWSGGNATPTRRLNACVAQAKENAAE